MIPLLAVVSLLHMGPAVHPSPGAETRRRFGGWTLQTRADPFRGALTCRLGADRMHVERGVLIVHLSRGADTGDAVYRLDGGAPVATRAEAMDMARRGLALTQDRLDNPSGGLVRIPAEQAAAAHALDVQSGPGRTPSRFRLDGLGAALEAARAAGCPLLADPPKP